MTHPLLKEAVSGRGWSVDNLAIAQKMWGEGFSAGLIGEAVGVSRNAVIGMQGRRRWVRFPDTKLHTMKKGRQGGRPRKSAVGPLSVPPRLKDRRNANPFGFNGRPKALPKFPVRRAKEVPVPTGSKPVRLIDAKSGQCAWIIGEPKGPDTLYCGAASGLASWCPFHRGVGWSKAA